MTTPKDTGKTQVYGRTDSGYGWRKRDGSGDIVAGDGTHFTTVTAAIEGAVDANPGIDRVEVLLDDDGSGNYSVPWGPKA